MLFEAHDRKARDKCDCELHDEFHTSAHAFRRTFHHFQIIVGKTEQPEAQRHKQHNPDIGIRQIRPEQCGGDSRHEDQQATHGGCALLLNNVPLRTFRADRLTLALARAQPVDHARADQKRDDQRRHDRATGAERDVAEHIQRGELICQRHEQEGEHGRS